LSASPRSTSNKSRRFFTRLRGARREPGDDPRKDAGVARKLAEPSQRTLRRLVCERPCALRAVLEEVAVLVQDVVDDLKQEPDLAGEGPPRRLLALKHLRDPEPARDRGGEEAPCLEP